MKAELQNVMPVAPVQAVVLTLTKDEASHLKRIVNGFQPTQDGHRHLLTEWTRRVKGDLWTKLNDLGIPMAGTEYGG